MIFKPYNYQAKAIHFVENHPEAALFLDMGLGKSVITLTAVKHMIDDLTINKALVIAPKKVAESTWTAEASKWEHLKGLRVVKVMGTETQRITALQTEADVYVIGRDSVVWLIKHLGKMFNFDMLILDELTSFKNSKALRFKALKAIRPKVARVVGLTGTPTPNGLIDLWAQMYLIDQGQRLGQYITRYRQAYFNEQRWNNIIIKTTPRKGAEEQIKQKISDISLTMQAKSYLELPPIVYHTEIIKLSEKVLKEYKTFERDMVLQTIKEAEDKPIIAASAAALMNKLSQYASGAVYDEEHDVHYIHDEKIAKLVEIVEAANSSVLVFYQFKHEIPRILKALKGYNTQVYEGNEQLQEWNKGNIDVLLAHPASTAFGLNMQHGGNYIVWFGTGWNLELYQQANARLHRQGQTKPVHVYKLICGETIDQRANKAIEGKETAQKAILNTLEELTREYGKG